MIEGTRVVGAVLLAAGLQAAPEGDPFIQKVDRLIADSNYHAASNSSYVVKTDDPRLDVEAVAALLGSFHDHFGQFWSGKMALRECQDRARIYLFYSRYKYRQIWGEDAPPSSIEPVGHYATYHDIVAVHTDSVGLENLPDLLVHEAAHQLVQVRIYGAGGFPSPWIAEGLASYFGNTLRDRSGAFVTGAIGGKRVTFFKGVSPGGGGTAEEEIRDYRRAIKKGAAVEPEAIISATAEEFYDENGTSERYTASWMLVHFLLHAGDGAHASGFVRYLEHEAAGGAGPDVFLKDIGMTDDELASSLAAYVTDLKVR